MSSPANAKNLFGVHRRAYARVGAWMRAGESISLLLGGADDLSPNALAQADEVWSLSALTSAHPLARVLVAEQMYRGFSRLENLPYHR